MAKLRADYIAQSLAYKLEDDIQNDFKDQIRDEYGEIEADSSYADIVKINGKDLLVIDEEGNIYDDVYIDDGYTEISDGRKTLELVLNEDGMVDGRIGNKEIGTTEAAYEIEYLGDLHFDESGNNVSYRDVTDYSYVKDGLDSSWSEVSKGSHKEAVISSILGRYNVDIRIDPQKYMQENKKELKQAGFNVGKAIKNISIEKKGKSKKIEEPEIER